MSVQRSRCSHINVIGDCRKEDIIKKQEDSKCDSCTNVGPNLWVCLHQDCLCTACGEPPFNHWLKHFENANHHCLFLNLTALRVYCLKCTSEVFLENNDPPLPGMITRQQTGNKMHHYHKESESEEEIEVADENLKPRGLTGLQNLGNTCYMNSALQALSNCPQLTNFFLECDAFVRSEKKPGMAKSYMRLVREMWHKRRPSYVVPSGIAYGIKMVFPVFRGFMQQDAQEFLRCFMDQLHEELKEVCVEVPGMTTMGPSMEEHDEFDSCHGESVIGPSEESSQSDGEFETCDSGLSSEKSSCGDDKAEETEFVNMTESSEIPNPNFLFDHSCPSPQVHSMVGPPIVEANIEMKRSLNFVPQQTSTINETTPLFGQSDTSDSGIPCSRTVDFSECESFSDRKSPCGISKFERFGDCNKYKQSTFSMRQCASSSQKRSLSPHSIGGSHFSSRRRKPVRYRSIVSDTFDGKILSSVQCLTCDTISTTRETFQDLSLPIPGRDHLHMLHASQGNQQKSASSGTCTDVYNQQGWFTWFLSWMLSWFWGPAVSLQDCLSAFFSADELKGDNMYSCEKCKKLRNGIKFSKVLELPEVLCVHLKRFRHEVMFSAKISNYVSFPLEGLDMSQFLHKNAYPRGVTTYDLAAVICHHGTAGSGHYTAYALNCLNDQWYEFDDQYVTAVDPQVVQNCEAYVLFYRKSTEEMVKKRQRAVELMERSKNEQGLLQFHISKQWINKFNTFADPGPITNTDFLCAHGGVPPNRVSYVEDLCTILPQAVWEYLHESFGGGPSCTHLYICPVCQAEQDSLNQRQETEYNKFVMLNNEFRTKDSPSAVYAISVGWFKIWESFVRGKESEPPGPIDNTSICYIKGNQPVLKLRSDYGSLSEDMWKYLLSIYGGGPEIVLQNENPTSCSSASCAAPTRPPSSTVPSSPQQIPHLHSTVKENHVNQSISSNMSTSSQEESDQSSKTETMEYIEESIDKEMIEEN